MQKVKSNTFKISNDLFSKEIPRFLSRTSKIINFYVFLKKLKMKANTCGFLLLFFEKNWIKCKKWSLTPSNKSIIIYFSNKCEKWCLKRTKYLSLMCSLKKIQNRRLTHAHFYFFKTYLKMQKVKSNTLKNMK